MSGPETDLLPYGPGVSRFFDAGWRSVLGRLLPSAAGGSFSLNRGWDLEWEREQVLRAAATGVEHLSVRLYEDEVVIGPRWLPATDSGCAGCAEVRGRIVLAHPLVTDLTQACSIPVPRQPLLLELVQTTLAHLADRPLQPGELYAVGTRASRRHRIPRSFGCPLCAPRAPRPAAHQRPGPLILQARPADSEDPARGASGRRLVEGRYLHDRLVDPRYGPVQQVSRESHAPFAMSMAAMPDAPAMGFGRASTFGRTGPVAILEAYERVGGFPYESPIIADLCYQDVSAFAVDPATLGQYTPEQLAHPSCRVTPSSPDTPMDWVWGHDLADGAPLLVPADIGFYQYDYRFKLDRHSARLAAPEDRRHFFHESSSGCALGSSLEEAALHSLFELAERDAFLLAWHRAAPLPRIQARSVADPDCRRLLELIESRGFEPFLLAATADIDVPVVWSLAVNRAGAFPATFSAAGSGADPVAAVRGALWELAQLVTDPADWDRTAAERMLADPWLVETIDDHIRLHALPEKLERVSAVLGGPTLTLAAAFPGWPEKLRRAAAGDVRGALEHTRAGFAAAGLDRIVLVDQSTREHADLGLSVAKAVVPGITPMCFGHAQQRLANLPRLAAAVGAGPGAGTPIPHDPHPFP